MAKQNKEQQSKTKCMTSKSHCSIGVALESVLCIHMFTRRPCQATAHAHAFHASVVQEVLDQCVVCGRALEDANKLGHTIPMNAKPISYFLIASGRTVLEQNWTEEMDT